MAKVTIDGTEYEFGDLSDEAKAQLQAIQFVDQEMARTNLNLAALQTARIAYGRALKEALGTEGDDETELELPDNLTFE